MPTYEYECSKCGKITEVFQSMKDAPRKKLRATDKPVCKCNAGVTRRISTGGGLIFKGSGFYITDYRNESYKQAAKADSEGGKSEKSDQSAKGDKKESPKKDAVAETATAATAKKEKTSAKSKSKE